MKEVTFIMMVGLPGSGKSKAAAEYAKKYDANIHSSDDIREEVFKNVNDQKHNSEVFEILHGRVKEDIKNGKACIYDATNISYKRRLAFLQEIRGFARRNDINLEAVCVLMCTPVEFCFKWNKHRERKVPFEVIDRMYKNFDVPYWYEGWDNIFLHYPMEGFINYYGDINSYIVNQLDYDQKNSHHKLSLGWHLEYSKNQIRGDEVVRAAAALHDCGKPYCCTFIDAKGNRSDEAHYYNHEKVGAYMALFFNDFQIGFSSFGKLDIAAIIRWHMQPYFMSEKDFEAKYKPKLGVELFNNVLKIHKADLAAH